MITARGSACQRLTLDETVNVDTQCAAVSRNGMEPPMYAVIFEVKPKPGRDQDYFATAQSLRSELERIDGFISVERFTSLTNEGKILSLSFWRDEAAVERWRTHAQHRAAQHRGREEIFADYRIRVASVLRDYGMVDRTQAPAAADGIG
jgi:heme-degrading monooxygenase HmoA